jgi:uncharacterized membrane protein
LTTQPCSNLTGRSRNLTLALIALYIVVFVIFTIGRYERYNATGWDLGIFTQLTWNAAHGRFLQNTIAEHNFMLAVHAPYITIVLAPLFWIWADPRMLLIAQTVILAVGAWPVARLAARYFPEWWVPPLFAALWLLYPSLGWNNRWDFHEIAPAATFLAFAFEATDRRAWRQTDLWLILAILCKEEVGLNVGFYGLYLWLVGRSRRASLFWILVGIPWFLIHAFVIFPTLRGADNNLPIHATKYYSWLLSGDLQVIWAYITGPDTLLKIGYLLKLFAPVGFVALFAPRPLSVAFPTILLALLSSWKVQFDIHMHYTAPIIPAVLIAAVYGAARLRTLIASSPRFSPSPDGEASGVRVRETALGGELYSRRRTAFRLTMTAMLLAALIMWIAYNPLYYRPSDLGIYGWEPGAHVEALNEVKQIIPPEACVVTENNIQPHYSVRPETYVLGARGDMDGCTYMIIDLGDPRHDDFTSGEEVACTQFWAQKRAPIYYRDTVVVLKQMPAESPSASWQQMNNYCAAYAKKQR